MRAGPLPGQHPSNRRHCSIPVSGGCLRPRRDPLRRKTPVTVCPASRSRAAATALSTPRSWPQDVHGAAFYRPARSDEGTRTSARRTMGAARHMASLFSFGRPPPHLAFRFRPVPRPESPAMGPEWRFEGVLDARLPRPGRSAGAAAGSNPSASWPSWSSSSGSGGSSSSGRRNKAEKARRAKLEAIQKGDKVRTRGGIEGVVVRVQDDKVIVRIDTEGRSTCRSRRRTSTKWSRRARPATKELK